MNRSSIPLKDKDKIKIKRLIKDIDIDIDMSTLTAQQQYELEDSFVEFVESYYKQRLDELTSAGKRVVVIDHLDLFQYDQTMADEYVEYPLLFHESLTDAVNSVSKAEYDFRVSVVNTPEVIDPNEVRAEDVRTYVGIKGLFNRITAPYLSPFEFTYRCKQCEEQFSRNIEEDGTVEPGYCSFCGKKGPFEELTHDREFRDECRIRLDARPDSPSNLDGSGITGVVRDELIDYGDRELSSYVGSDVVFYGVLLDRKDDDDRYGYYLDVRGFEFVNDDSDIDLVEYEEVIREEASKPDCLERFAQSIAPELYATDKWDTIFKLTVAYLFGSPRVDVPDGPTYRGDIHVAIISDPGMGKSLFTRSVELFSPKCERRSATGLASDVGLTAAAVQDTEFGKGEWTLKPGILVRGNGGHVIIDEIDKGPDNLERINDGLEGEQIISIDKGGISAKLRTRVGLLVTGNPKNGRFDQDEYSTIADEIDVDPTLLSRFDGIVTMVDYADEARDKKISETVGNAYKESLMVENGEREELDELQREIPVELGRAWVKFARENVEPVPTDAAIEKLSTWFSEDARQLNDDKQVVPATMRQFETGLRLASAYARLRLSDTLELVDVDRAIQVSKELIGENYDSSANVFDASVTDEGQRKMQSQKDKREAIVGMVRQQNEPVSVDMIASSLSIELGEVENHVDKLVQARRLYEPETGRFDVV